MEDHTNFVLILCPYPDSSVGKESTCNVGDPGLIPGSGRSPGEEIGYPLQYSGLENSMDCIVPGDRKESDESAWLSVSQGFPRWPSGKESVCNVGDKGSIPGSGRSPEEGNGNPLQYSCLGDPTDGGAWRATAHRVTKSRTGLKRLSPHVYIKWTLLLSIYLLIHYW